MVPNLTQIHSKNLNILPLEKKDLTHKVRWYNDPEVSKTLILDERIELEKTIQWFDKIQKDSSRIDWLIESKECSPIGLIGLVGIDADQKSAEIFIVIGEKEYWGKGVMLEAEAAVIRWAFDILGLEKIWAQARADNIASAITMKKLGFQIEAALSKTKKIAGQDVVLTHFVLRREKFCLKDPK